MTIISIYHLYYDAIATEYRIAKRKRRRIWQIHWSIKTRPKHRDK
jgi:hypothetical protein